MSSRLRLKSVLWKFNVVVTLSIMTYFFVLASPDGDLGFSVTPFTIRLVVILSNCWQPAKTEIQSRFPKGRPCARSHIGASFY